MSLFLHKDIEKLKKRILSLSALVEESVRDALKAFHEADSKLAARVIRTDVSIDNREIEVEDDCLKILALNQPVAIDLRFIVAVLKINNDLERIGDLATNIAEQAVFRSRCPSVAIPGDLEVMADMAQAMLRQSLDALVNMDTDLARRVFVEDDEVDRMLLEMFRLVKERIAKDPRELDCNICLLLVSRHLERIADLATNIAEDVVYMMEGKIVRHQAKEGPA